MSTDMVSILRQSPNFLPAYHMNKTHWLTIVLDHGVETKRNFQVIGLELRLNKVEEFKTPKNLTALLSFFYFSHG